MSSFSEEPPNHSINRILVKGGRKRKDWAGSNLEYSKVVRMSQPNQCGVCVLISGIPHPAESVHNTKEPAVLNHQLGTAQGEM